jgi:hypothetical protein
MANTKISALPLATTPLAGTEVLPIVQGGITEQVATNDLTVRNIRANATTGILQVTGPAAASTRVMTVPNANFTAARTDAAQSFTGDQTLSTGNIIQGTAGKGIDFTANTPAAGMTSELLNWYETGTWTPTYTAGSGAFTTLTYAAQTGVYTRIGNVVYIKCEIRTSNVVLGTASGLLRIVGLPFTPAAGATAGLTMPLFLRFNLGTSTLLRVATVDTGGIYVETSLSNDTGGNQIVVSQMTTGASASANYIMVSGFYNV